MIIQLFQAENCTSLWLHALRNWHDLNISRNLKTDFKFSAITTGTTKNVKIINES